MLLGYQRFVRGDALSVPPCLREESPTTAGRGAPPIVEGFRRHPCHIGVGRPDGQQSGRMCDVESAGNGEAIGTQVRGESVERAGGQTTGTKHRTRLPSPQIADFLDDRDGRAHVCAGLLIECGVVLCATGRR